MRSRKASDLVAEALQGHLSAACCHLANISYRLGKKSPPDAIHASIRGERELSDAFDRCREYLGQNGVDLGVTPATLGTGLTFDPKRERFVGDFAQQAHALAQREYRKPFVVPKIA